MARSLANNIRSGHMLNGASITLTPKGSALKIPVKDSAIPER